MPKARYVTPNVDVIPIDSDIITYSETIEWTGPVIGAESTAETQIKMIEIE